MIGRVPLPIFYYHSIPKKLSAKKLKGGRAIATRFFVNYTDVRFKIIGIIYKSHCYYMVL
jgi:hypothetical protein